MTDYSWYSRPNMSYPSTDLMTSQATSTTEVMNHQLQLFYRQLPPIPTTSTDTDSSTNSPTTPTSTSPVSIGAALPATTSVPWNEPIVESVHHQGGHPTPTSSNEKKRPRQMSAISQGVRVEKNTQGKPPYSYATLIRYAIENSPAQKLTLNEIYGWVLEHYTYYKTAGSGWKNSIRHNLSLNKSFVRVPRPINEPGKGSYWIIDYTAAEDEQRAKQTYRGRSSRSASDATPPSLPYQPASAPSVRRHSDTRYLGNDLNNSSLPTATAPAPANSASMPTPTDYYYMYSDRYAQQQQQQQQQSYNGYRAHSNNYANVQHHHSCHLFTGSNGMHHQQQQQQQPHHYYNTHQPHYHHYPHHTHLPHHQQQQQPSYSTTSSASSASDRPLSPTPSNLFPPELSVTLSSVTSPHSSLSEEHLGSPLPQHFALETAVDTDDVDHQDKPRKRTKCQHTKTLESDPSTLHWPVVL